VICCFSVWKVAGLTPDGVIGILFIDAILPAALGLPQPLNKNEYQGSCLKGKVGGCVGLPSLSPSCADCLEILWASVFWTPVGLSRPVEGEIYLYLIFVFHVLDVRMSLRTNTWMYEVFLFCDVMYKTVPQYCDVRYSRECQNWDGTFGNKMFFQFERVCSLFKFQKRTSSFFEIWKLRVLWFTI
jgi:hypothetical protein